MYRTLLAVKALKPFESCVLRKSSIDMVINKQIVGF